MLSLVTATVGVPLLLGVLCLGAGFLVDRASGRWLPLLLIGPVGFAALVGVLQIGVAWTWLAPLAPVLSLIVALAGYLLNRERVVEAARALIRQPWVLAAALATYMIAMAPVVFAGRVTLPAYLLDSTVGAQLSGADALLTHGRDFTELSESSYSLYLQGYFGRQYPSGAHLPLGLLGRLLPVDLLWLYQPYLSAVMALATPSLLLVLRRFGVPTVLAAVGCAIAALPALVYAYGLMGAIKEIGVLPLLALLLALVVVARRWIGTTPFAPLPFALTVAAGVSTIGLAFGAWTALACLILATSALLWISRRHVRPAVVALQAAVIMAVAAVAALPTVTDLTSSLTLAKGLSQSYAPAANDPGNLLQPLHWQQVFGVWLQGTHRLDPSNHQLATWTLIAVVGLAALFGVAALVRRRQWPAIAYIAGAALIWWLLTRRGTVWTDAKLIVLSSPLAIVLAFAGIGGLLAATRRAEAVLLTVLVAGGVLWSDALLYHDTNLAPTGRFEEQQRIADRFGGQGPALLTDFDEYALFELRDLDPSAPGLALKPPVLATLVNGTPVPYGASVDIDQLPEAALDGFPIVVERRSPDRSIAPFGYELAFEGRYYRVWRRTARADLVAGHLGLQSPNRASARAPCRTIREFVRSAKPSQRLLVARRPRMIIREPAGSSLSGSWSGNSVVGPARLTTDFRAPRSGRYRIYLKGDINRPFSIAIDGDEIGSVGYQTGGQGHVTAPIDAELDAGVRGLMLTRGGGTLEPGNGGPARLDAVLIEPAWEGAQPSMSSVPVRDWRSLCGQELDWIELVDGPSRD